MDHDPTSPRSPEALLVYTAFEDMIAVIEAERRRLAGLLESDVIESLNLLLAQANVYERTLAVNPTTRLAISVLASLARQAIQQARDLEASLRPTILETLGLEAALEGLTGQIIRAHGLQITLTLARRRERLSPPVELALFRLTQDALYRIIHYAQASQVTIQLAQHHQRLTFTVSDNGATPAGQETLRTACQRIDQLGGRVEIRTAAQSGLELTVTLALSAPVELTVRETEVLQWLAEGLSNKEIARRLSVSPRTVNFHLDNIYSKLNVNSRTEAAIYALRQGIVRRPTGGPG